MSVRKDSSPWALAVEGASNTFFSTSMVHLCLVLVAHCSIACLLSVLWWRSDYAYLISDLALYIVTPYQRVNSHQSSLNHARPALPIWILSPVHLSSLRSTGQLVPSALARVSSSLVPSTRNCDFSGSIGANSGYVSWNRLLSVVGRLKSIEVEEKSTLALALSIFLR